MQIKHFFIDWRGSAFVATFASENIDKWCLGSSMSFILLCGERYLQHEGSNLYSL